MGVNKKIGRIILIVFLISLIGFVFLQFLPISFPDSILYEKHSEIISGLRSMSEWDFTRGFSFSLILSYIYMLLGNSLNSLNIGMFVIYTLLIICNFIIIKKCTKNIKTNGTKFIVYIIFVLLFVLNPLIIGYSHTLLTESVAPLLISLMVFIMWKFIDYEKGYKLWSSYILLIILSIFLWFLKQPFYIAAFSIIFIGTLLSTYKLRNFKNTIIKMSLVLNSVLFLFIGIKVWNNYLEYNQVKQGISNTTFFADGIIKGMTNYRFVPEEEYESIINENNFTNTELDNINSIENASNDLYSNFIIRNLVNIKGESIKYIVLFTKDETPSTTESVFYFLNSWVEHPVLMLDSYLSNYLSIINVYSVTSEVPAANYYPLKTLKKHYIENEVIGLATFNEGSNFMWKNSELIDEVPTLKNKEEYNEPNKLIASSFRMISPFFLFTFKLFFIISTVAGFVYFITYFNLKNKKISKTKIKILELLIIVFLTSTIHIVFHAVMGALIDRYAYIMYPSVITAIILILVLHSKENGKQLQPYKQKHEKVLVTIPAYNEELNIEGVITELKKDFKNADVLVINDCSTDGTKEILEKNKVNFITPPFNMKYAYAIQTGIRYAYINDYDCVIQFDGDGQHIAKEASKLLKKMKETNCDIVIGSRFKEKTGYKHPLFRKIGTEIFSKLIKNFTGKNITDPTSGFQCLNKRVIQEYSKLGVYPEFPDANLIMDMLLKGYIIEEISTKMRLREFGESMHSGIIKPIKYMITVTYSAFLIIIKHIELEKKYYE